MPQGGEWQDSGAPRHMLVLDPAVFERSTPRTIRQFMSRLGKVRGHTAFVLLGDRLPEGFVLPVPDYLISDDGSRIIRQPTGDAIGGWPADGQPVDQCAAALHLADALMVPRQEIHVVVSEAHRKLLGICDKGIAVGVKKPPPGSIRLRLDLSLIHI